MLLFVDKPWARDGMRKVDSRYSFGPDLSLNLGFNGGGVFGGSGFGVGGFDACGGCMNFDCSMKRERSARRPRFLRRPLLRRFLLGFMKCEITRRNDGMKSGVSSGGASRSSSASPLATCCSSVRPGSGCRKREPLTL